jgi:hypothetical protein
MNRMNKTLGETYLPAKALWTGRYRGWRWEDSKRVVIGAWIEDGEGLD